MNQKQNNFSNKKIVCNVYVNEYKFPFLRTIKTILQKVPQIEACYLIGPIIHHNCQQHINIEPIIHLIIFSENLTDYTTRYICEKTKEICYDFFFPKEIMFQPYFVHGCNMDKYLKFRIKCEGAFWFGDKKKIDNLLDDFCMKDISTHTNNYNKCSSFIKSFIKKNKGTTLWINIYILYDMIIKSIYEKNAHILERHYLTCKSKHRFIIENSQISIIDKEITKKCYKDIKIANQKNGSNLKLDTEFLTFIINYFDFCKNEITLDELFEKEFSTYRSWLKYIYTDDQNIDENIRTDFKFLFNKTSNDYFNRIHSNQPILNETGNNLKKKSNKSEIIYNNVDGLSQKKCCGSST